MKTAGYSSFRVLDATSPELQEDNRTIQMNNENRIIVVNFDEAFNLVLPEQTPDNKQIEVRAYGNTNVVVRFFPFGTSQVDIDALTGMIAEMNVSIPTRSEPQTFTFQFLNGVTYVTKSIGSSDVVETEVSFTFAQIRAMGTTPLELLPAPGVGKYNDVSGVTVEYKHVGVTYTAATAANIAVKNGSTTLFSVDISMLTGDSSFYNLPANGNTGSSNPFPLNTALTATTDDASDLTNGTGTLKFIISYKIRTVA